MSKEDLEFEVYFRQVLQDEKETIQLLQYTEEQLRQIYRDSWEWKLKIPKLELHMESQELDYETVQNFLPEKWEMPREGKLLYDDEELQQVLKLIVFNIGVRKCLDVIPRELIEQYLKNNNK